MKNKCLTRTCISCRAKKDKKELIRIVKNKDGVIKVDLSQRLEGRGAYICEDKNCFDKMQKGNRLKSTLKISVDNKKYEELRGVIFDRTE
ncbi:MAG: YlxR family protein [Clostridia bacterium]|nr:YlxR family protein [Clostridia bacterium]MCI9275579.1 YlxR family protein [Clostridia bacterium]